MTEQSMCEGSHSIVDLWIFLIHFVDFILLSFFISSLFDLFLYMNFLSFLLFCSFHFRSWCVTLLLDSSDSISFVCECILFVIALWMNGVCMFHIMNLCMYNLVCFFNESEVNVLNVWICETEMCVCMICEVYLWVSMNSFVVLALMW